MFTSIFAILDKTCGEQLPCRCDIYIAQNRAGCGIAALAAGMLATTLIGRAGVAANAVKPVVN
jgi:hypothetical protein